MATTELPYRIPKQRENLLPWEVEQNLETLRDAFDKYVAGVGTAPTPKIEASGQATIAQSTTAITVTHNLGIAGAYSVVFTSTKQQADGNVWVSSKTSNSFVINSSATAGIGGWTYNWILREN